MQYGHFWLIVEDVMAPFAHIEYKEYGEINKMLEAVVGEFCVDIYGDLRSALRIVERVGRVQRIDNPNRTGSFL